PVWRGTSGGRSPDRRTRGWPRWQPRSGAAIAVRVVRAARRVDPAARVVVPPVAAIVARQAVAVIAVAKLRHAQ
ncbi:hypothetical protein XPU_3976, partial [Xanthomonas arboricola pv. pruni str. MAFF 311562]